MSTVFVIQGKELIEMAEAKYPTEAELQDLLERYPALIPGDQIDSTKPRRWLLVKREAGVPDKKDAPDRWSVDHLFLDQDAVPTLVEVKRSENTEIRRRIVGQMLDYAANAVVHWPVERIRTDFESRCNSEQLDPDEELRNFLGDENSEDFWKQVKTNLQAGRIRLLFVADQIPDELRRIVEFLNEQMDPAEVLAVQVRRFKSESVQTLVPQVFGATAHAQTNKGAVRPTKKWNLETFLSELEAQSGQSAVKVTNRFLEWAEEKLPRLDFGRGTQEASMFAVLDHAGHNYYPVGLWTSGTVQVQFGQMRKFSPFDNEAVRREFLQRLNKIPGVSLSQRALSGRKYPTFKMELLATEKPMRLFLEALDWFVEQAKGYNPDE